MICKMDPGAAVSTPTKAKKKKKADGDIKVVLCGDAAVGKSSIFNRCVSRPGWSNLPPHAAPAAAPC